MFAKIALTLAAGLALAGAAEAQRTTTVRGSVSGPGASEFAPGQQPRTATMRGASQFAPGQRATATRPARTLAPGQRARVTSTTSTSVGGGSATVRVR